MFTLKHVWLTLATTMGLPCGDVMVRVGGCPPCIIILWCEFVFWGLYLYLRVVVFDYKVPFSIFELHAFCCLVQKTRLTSNVQFFQLIFVSKVIFCHCGICQYARAKIFI